MLLQEIMINENIHIKKLQNYLYRFSDKSSVVANNASHYSRIRSELMRNDHNCHIRCALRDIQTRMGDICNLSGMYTDPLATAIFKEIHQDLAQKEQQLLEMYKLRTTPKVKSHNLVVQSTRTM
jgi:protease I